MTIIYTPCEDVTVELDPGFDAARISLSGVLFKLDDGEGDPVAVEDLQEAGVSAVFHSHELRAIAHRLTLAAEQLDGQLAVPSPAPVVLSEGPQVRLLKISEAAKAYNLPLQTLFTAIEKRTLPALDLGQGKRPVLRVYGHEVEAWLDSRRVQ